MRKKFLKVITFLLVAFSFAGSNSQEIKVNAAVGTTPSVKYSSTLSSSYYNSVSGKTGDSLLEGLASLTYSNHKYYTTYEEIKGGNAYSDKDPNNSSKMIDFYTGWSIPNDWDGGSTWNREHVWCQSLSGGLFGTTGAGSDIHHIRPLISSINSARNNGLFTDTEHCGSVPLEKYYYTGTKVPAYTGQWTGCYTYNQDYWEPRDNEKGDIARILMYMYMHYSKEVSANSSHSNAGALSVTNIVYTSTRTSSAAWDMLLDWNELDPVSSFEKNRNNYCASVTGTRNPFVDHPEYANAIWGDGTLNGGSSSGSTGDNEDSSGSGGGSSDSGNSGGTTGTTQTITTTKYRQLKSANGITVGSKIIIAAKDYNYALSTNQKTNNRGVTSITKYTSGSDTYLNTSSSTQILEVKGTKSGAYSLYTGSGYLASASSSENILQTKSSVGSGSNAYWKISFSNGAASIVAQGSYTRNTLRYNSSSGLFSCYAANNSQKDVAIFKAYTETTTIVIPGTGSSGNTDSDSSYQYPEKESLLTIEKALEVCNQTGTTFTSDKYKIQGTIASIDDTTYGNMTIKDSSGNSIYVYGVYSSDGTLKYSELTNKPQVGDEITLIGTLGMYYSTPEMKSGWIVEASTHSHSLVTTFDVNYHYEVCSGCNETLSTSSHTYEEEVTSATCLNGGYTIYSCSCGYTYKGNIVSANGHTYDEGEVIKEATTSSYGEKIYTCINCDDTYKELIDKLPVEDNPDLDNPEQPVVINTTQSLLLAKHDNGSFTAGTRFAIHIPEKLINEYQDQITGYGFALSLNGKTYVDVPALDENVVLNDGVKFALVVNNIPEENYATDILAKAYIEIGEIKVYFNQIGYSVVDMIESYKINLSNLSEEQKELIEEFDLLLP